MIVKIRTFVSILVPNTILHSRCYCTDLAPQVSGTPTLKRTTVLGATDLPAGPCSRLSKNYLERKSVQDHFA